MGNMIDTGIKDGAFSTEKLPPIFVYGETKLMSDEAYLEYEKLLFMKWTADKIAPRCNISR